MDWEALAKKEFLEGDPIEAVSSKDIPIQDGKIISTALNWIKENPIGSVKTLIGDVGVDEDSINTSMEHTHYKNKVLVLPVIKPILERGVFLGELDDFYGLPERNFYFAAPIGVDGDKKIVFIRVKQKREGNKKFYVHEVFTEDEIKNAAPLEQEIAKRKARVSNMQPDALAFRPDRKQSDLYRSILNDVLSVKAAP
jgi:hypothetical protein